MREDHHVRIRRRQHRIPLQHDALLSHSQSLDDIADRAAVDGFATHRARDDSSHQGGIGYGADLRTNSGSRGGSNFCRAPHLPPLGRKFHRYSDNLETRRTPATPIQASSPARRKFRRTGWSKLRSPTSETPTTPVPHNNHRWDGDAQWATTVDVVVGSGEAAGIAFQWIEAHKVAGLSVVDVVSGSVSARHGRIFPGMMLVGINRVGVFGMGREDVMRAMHAIVGQPRVLTLAIKAAEISPAPSHNPTTEVQMENGPSLQPSGTAVSDSCALGNDGLREEGNGTSYAYLQAEKPSAPLPFSVAVKSRETDAFPTAIFPPTPGCSSPAKSTTPPASHTYDASSFTCRSKSGTLTESSRPHPAVSLSDGDHDACSVGAAFATSGSPPTGSVVTTVSGRTPGVGAGSMHRVAVHPDNQQQRQPPQLRETTLALRFVCSRGDISLYDRDHILGLKKRAIEFVMSVEPRSKAQRANSHRSLGELSRDWRNDPCSTPARRRRLINDVCKVIIRSYENASVVRVSEFRQQGAVAVKIQAIARMYAARRRYAVARAEHRTQAATSVQLASLSYIARRKVWALRQERDRVRREEDDKRRKILIRDREEKIRREEEKANEDREKEELARKQRERELIVLVQRQFRTLQELRRSTEQARRQRIQRQRDVARAVILSQTVFRIRRDTRQKAEGARKVAAQRKTHAAIGLLQVAWKRSRSKVRAAASGQKASDFAATSVKDGLGITFTRTIDGAWSTNELTPSSPDSDAKTHGATGVDAQGAAGSRVGNDAVLSWEGWAEKKNPALAADMARERDVSSGVGGAIGGEVRPRTAAAAVQATLSLSPYGGSSSDKGPPASMMTVKVKVGEQETSLVTPIVVTERCNGTGDGASETRTRSKNLDGQTSDDEGLSPEICHRIPSHVSAASWVQQGGIPAPANLVQKRVLSSCTENLAAHWATGQIGTTTDAFKSNATLVPSRFADYVSQHVVAVQSSGISESFPPAESVSSDMAMAKINRSDEIALLRRTSFGASTGTNNEEQTQQSEKTSGGDNSGGAGAGPPTERREIEAVDNFMEDSQVYLGCSFCGVKYLVEAVDTRLPSSSQGQPDPEVLYFCTTCGGILRAGEDGRWRRRRRPSSAPASSRRRRTVFDPASSKHQNLDGKGRARDDGEGDAEDFEDGERRGGVSVADDMRGTAEKLTKLRYACCARRIQNAYRDFRHRRYLIDWALSVLRQWLLSRMHDRRRSNLLRRRRRAVVTLQAAARAIFARARCRALRDDRLRLWVGLAALLHEKTSQVDDCFRPSPVGKELWRERSNDAPSLASPLPRPVALDLGLGSPVSSPQQGSLRESTVGIGIGVQGRCTSSSRALAEALAPTMGDRPPGCPGALDVDWGEWGVKLTLVFPPPAPADEED